MKKIKNIFILLALITSFAVTVEAANKKSSQKTINETINKQTMEEELALADEYYYAAKLLKAKAIYEKYSSVNNKAKFSLAVYYIEDLQKEKGIKLLEELAQKKEEQAIEYLVSIYHENNDIEKLEKIFNPKNKQDMKKLAEIYSNNGYSEKASEIYRNLTLEGDKDAYFSMISNFSDSAQIDLLLLESSKGNTKADKKLGYLYFQNSDYKNSIKHFKKYLKKSKGDEDIFSLFASYYYSQELTIEELTKELSPYIKRGDEGAKEALELYSTYKNGNNDMTTCVHEDYDTHEYSDDFEENEKYYLDMLAENENNVHAIDQLYDYYRSSNDQIKLNNFLNSLIDSGFYLGNNWKLAENPLELYKNYILQGINRAKPVLADIYLDNNDFENAAVIYKDLIAQNPSNNDFVIQLSDIYNKNGQYNKTLDLVMKSRTNKNKDQCYLSSSSEYEKFQKSFVLNFLSAFADYKLGNLEKAKDEYKCLSNEDYDNSSLTFVNSKDTDFYYPVNIYLLDIYKQQGNEEDYKLLEDSMLSDISYYGSYKKELADYYASNGNFQKAEEILKISSAMHTEYNNTLTMGFNIESSDSQIIKLILKYKDYNEIRTIINEILFLADNSRDNSFNYFNSFRIASTYNLKNNTNQETSEFLKDILKKHSNSSLKNNFKNSYRNLYKNKKGISFYPDSVESNIFLSQLLSEWGINTETLDSKNNSNSNYIKSILLDNISLFFAYKHSDLFNEVSKLTLYHDTDEKEAELKMKNILNKFNKINYEKEYKEFYELLPAIIITDIQEKLKIYQKQDFADRIQDDYKKYLSEDKLEKLKDMKKINEDNEDNEKLFQFLYFTLF